MGMPDSFFGVIMKKRRFIYTNKKHPKRSIMSGVLGILCILSLATAVFLTYRAGGETHAGYGLTGLLSLIFSVTGVSLGISGLRLRESFRLFSVLGIILNALVILWLGLLVYWGSM